MIATSLIFTTVKTWLKDNWKPLVIGLSVIVAVVALTIAIKIYGRSKYDQGYNERSLSCIMEKADDNANRKDSVIEQLQKGSIIDSKPNLSGGDLLNLMRQKQL